MTDLDFSQTYLYKLHLLTNNLDKVLDQILLARANVTLSQFVLLISVRQKQPVGQREVATFLMLSPAAVSRQTEVLKKKGWLQVEPSQKDRRVDVLTITESGHEVIQCGLEALEVEVFQIFDKQDMNASLMDHLDSLLTDIERVSNSNSN